MTTVVPVRMSSEFENRVQYLCKKIPKEEWSGILLYRPKGTIKELGDFSIDLVDIIPLDHGSQAYTTYDNFAELLEYFNEVDPQIEEDYQDGKILIGHIHSHNTMNVFFSGTDTQELMTNCPNHFYYLSLIVNNFMEFCCKIAIYAKVEFKQTVYFKCKDELGEEFDTFETPITYNKEKMFELGCVIQRENPEMFVPETFQSRVDKIMEKAKLEKEKALQAKKNPTYPITTGYPKNNQTLADRFSSANSLDKYLNPFDPSTEEDTPLFSSPDIRGVEEFVKYLLNFGIRENKSLEKILASREHAWSNFTINKIIENYYSNYDRFFLGENHSLDEFVRNLDIVIDILEEHTTYAFVRAFVPALKVFRMNIVKLQKDEVSPALQKKTVVIPEGKKLTKKQRKDLFRSK